MKSNNGILTEKEIQAGTKFWNKKQFRTWTKKKNLKEPPRTCKNFWQPQRNSAWTSLKLLEGQTGIARTIQSISYDGQTEET